MALRPRITMLLVVLGLAAAVGAAFASTYPRLSDSHDAVETRWVELRSALASRYDHAERLAVVAGDARPDLDVAGDLGEAVDAWTRAARSPDRGPQAANRVEGLATRVARIVTSSASLRDRPEIVAAVRAFAGDVPQEAVDAYAAAVERYDRARGRFPGRWFASLLGFDAVSTVDIPTALEDLELPTPTTTTAAASG